MTGVLPGWAQSDPPVEVTVPDAAPRAVLEDSLGLAAEAPIMAAELTDLGARDSGILDLTGLEHATGPTPSLSATETLFKPQPSQWIRWRRKRCIDLFSVTGHTGYPQRWPPGLVGASSLQPWP